jgi:YwiC-like protein
VVTKIDFERDLGGVAVRTQALRTSEAAARRKADEGSGVPASVGAGRAGVGVRVRTIALPVEHGGWGISLEPVVLGLLVAPSTAGAWLALATLGAFLARHPLKIVAGDRRRGREFARTPVARRFVLLYGAAALAAFALSVLTAPSYLFLLPLAVAAPLACAQLFYDAAGRSRSLLPEVAGSVGMASVAAAIALAGGASLPLALGLWAVLAARVVPTILYVRARLAELHGKEAARWPSLVAHAAALAFVAALAASKVAPWTAVALMLVLLARAAVGFARHWPATARRVGFSEIAFGALTVLSVAAGVWFRL